MATTISEGLAALNNTNLSKLQKNLDSLKVPISQSGSGIDGLNAIDEELVRKKILPVIEKVMKLKR